MKLISALSLVLGLMCVTGTAIFWTCNKPKPVQTVEQPAQSTIMAEASQRIVELEQERDALTGELQVAQDKPPVVVKKVIVQTKTVQVPDQEALESLRTEYEAQMDILKENQAYYENALAASDTIQEFPAEVEETKSLTNYSGIEEAPDYRRYWEISVNGTLERNWSKTELPKTVDRKNYASLTTSVQYDFKSKETIFPVQVSYGRNWWVVTAGKSINTPAYSAGVGVSFRF